MAWIAEMPYVASSLTHVNFSFDRTTPGLVNRVFHHFAFCEGLKRLHILSDDDDMHGAVFQTTMQNNVATLPDAPVQDDDLSQRVN